MRKFLGCPYPIVPSVYGYLSSKINNDLNQIKSDLLILLLTNPGERCLTGDTLIPLADGNESTIMDLVGRPAFWVYSYDNETNSILPGLATAHKTAENASLMKVTLDNGEVVRCTPDHLWLLRDGLYCRTDQLKINDSLMPLYRNLNSSKYERVYQPYLRDYRETHLCFVEGKRETGVREVVHHKDLDKRNNSPDNLHWMTRQDHVELHKQIRSKFDEKMKNDPTFYEEWLSKQKEGLKKYYETHDGHRKGVVLSDDTKKKLSTSSLDYFQTSEGMGQRKILSQLAIEQFKTQGHPCLGKNHSKETKQKMKGPRPEISGDNNHSKRPEVREKLKEAWVRRRQKNHKVANIEVIYEREDCYDLTVEKYHNFGLSAGVFVHNCMLPQFGTPLRELIFEPNDAILVDRARQMIIDSINTFEPRITVSEIQVSSSIDPNSLNPLDTKTEIQNILSIMISFFDPANIQSVQTLSLEVPLGGN